MIPHTSTSHIPPLPTTQDADDLLLCDQIASHQPWSRLFLRLKDALLARYGQRDGYALQRSFTPNPDLASDDRIFEQYVLCGRLVHRPTPVFSSSVRQPDGHYIDQTHPQFDELAACIITILEPPRSSRPTPKDTRAAWRAMTRLLRRHRALLD